MLENKVNSPNKSINNFNPSHNTGICIDARHLLYMGTPYLHYSQHSQLYINILKKIQKYQHA